MEPTTPEPTVESHPWQVGGVVYRTYADAFAKAEYASGQFPTEKVKVVRRETGNVIALFVAGELLLHYPELADLRDEDG